MLSFSGKILLLAGKFTARALSDRVWWFHTYMTFSSPSNVGWFQVSVLLVVILWKLRSPIWVITPKESWGGRTCKYFKRWVPTIFFSLLDKNVRAQRHATIPGLSLFHIYIYIYSKLVDCPVCQSLKILLLSFSNPDDLHLGAKAPSSNPKIPLLEITPQLLIFSGDENVRLQVSTPTRNCQFVSMTMAYTRKPSPFHWIWSLPGIWKVGVLLEWGKRVQPQLLGQNLGFVLRALPWDEQA